MAENEVVWRVDREGVSARQHEHKSVGIVPHTHREVGVDVEGVRTDLDIGPLIRLLSVEGRGWRLKCWRFEAP